MTNRMIERRFLPLGGGVELRADDAAEREISGYAAVFNSEAVIWSAFREEFAPGAFAKTLQEGDIRALWNHDAGIVLGRQKAGTLALSEDERGLRVVIQPPDNEWGRPVWDAVKRGDVTGMSIAFRAIKYDWMEPELDGGLGKRVVREAQLLEISPVTFPAYTATSAQARADGAGDDTQEDELQRAIRLARCAELGMSLMPEHRAVMAAAVERLAGLISEPEPTGHHSEAHDEPEPDGHHSASDTAATATHLELLQRRLALLRHTL